PGDSLDLAHKALDAAYGGEHSRRVRGKSLAITHECLMLLLVLLDNQWPQLNIMSMPIQLACERGDGSSVCGEDASWTRS
ncbi:hypothetical protein LINPERPRIM_LOCUS23693, partial [Linum perenne]